MRKGCRKKKCSSSSVVDCLWYHYATSAHPYLPVRIFSQAHCFYFVIRCTFENIDIQAPSVAKITLLGLGLGSDELGNHTNSNGLTLETIR